MDRSLITLDRMRSFVRVAERGTFSAVARDHGVGQSTITRHVAELEKGLGVSLLNRTTRRVALTDEGARYCVEAREILRLVDEATDEASNAGGAPSGRVRISCTAALGVRHVTEAFFAFQDRYPSIEIEFSLSDERIDLVRDAVDIAIRLGPLSDSSMLLNRIGTSRRILVASPDYLAHHGRPAVPDDLQQHQAIRMSNIVGGETLSLEGTDGVRHVIPFTGRLTVDHGLAVREALIRGRGVAAAHIWLIDDLLSAGTVQHILPEFELEPVPLSILFVPARAKIRRVRLVIDALSSFLSEVPGIMR